MINSIIQRLDNLIEINFVEKKDYISCQVMYSINNIEWNAAAIYPAIESEFLFNGCDFLWSQGQEDGVVRLYNKDDYKIYWNYVLNIPFYIGKVYIKIIFVTEGSIYEDLKDIDIKDVGVLYFADWETYLGKNGSYDPNENENKWHIIKNKPFNYICMKFKTFLPKIKIPVNCEGFYDIYIGMKTGTPKFLIRTENNYFERLICGGLGMSLYKSNFACKPNKEIYWSSSYFDCSTNSYIEIAQLQETINSFQDMGKISYIKLVPIEKNKIHFCTHYAGTQSNKKLYTGELILYYEPYSYTLHGFHDAESMNTIMLEEFIRMNPTEITCQTVRIGAKCLHHSKFLERNNKPARTDENTIIDDPAKLAQNCDILEESIKHIKEYIKDKNVHLSSNIGMNSPYAWLPELSEKFTRDHPELLLNGYFDYKRREVQEYALQIIYEIIDDYDVDGMVFDYMRSYNNQTVETLVDIIKKTKERLNKKEIKTGEKLELKVRIPADQVIYCKAMQICVENGYIDGIIPSNVATSEPLPPLKHYKEMCKGTKVKVYGCIDGWKHNLGNDPRAGSLDFAHTPNDIMQYMNHYNNERADGIFMYQGDQFTPNPYINALFK